MSGNSNKQNIVCAARNDTQLGRRSLLAAHAILVLAGLYALHGVASFAIAPSSRLTTENAIGGTLVLGVMEAFFVLSSRRVRRSGSTAVAAVIVSLCAAGAGVGAVFGSRSTGPNKAWFVALQFLVFGWALLTLVLLLRVYDARTNLRAVTGPRTE